jgi:hypothetical protein
MRRRTSVFGVAAVGIAAGLLVTPASPASAGPPFGCERSAVCVYLTSADWIARRPTASFTAVTPDFVGLGPRSRHAYAVFNSRFDDVVYLMSRDQTEVCVEPHSTWFHDESGVSREVAELQIVDDFHCYLGGGF